MQARCRLAEWHSAGRCWTAAPARGRAVRWTTSSQGVIGGPILIRGGIGQSGELWRGNELLDQIEQPFGLRVLERRGNQLFLNGQPLYLRGMCEHGYFPLTTTPPRDEAFYRDNCMRPKGLGYNGFVFILWVPSAEYLRAADDAGMLVQLEPIMDSMPPIGSGFCAWPHPSLGGPVCLRKRRCIDAPRLKMMRRMASIARREAPDALFNPQSALRGVEYGDPAHLGQGAVAWPYPHHPGKLTRLKKFADVFAPYCWGMLSHHFHQPRRLARD